MAYKQKKVTSCVLPKATVIYRDKLEPVVKARYLEKLKLISGNDPFELKRLSTEVNLLPSLTYPDIVNYLIFTPSVYTLDDLKNFKSLDAVNQVECGWVSGVSTVVINGKHLVKGRVLHSQRVRDKLTIPWFIAEKNGKVLASHCDCMAGCGETCTHVAALMFSVIGTVKVRDDRTVTQDPAYWLIPTSIKSVEYQEVSDINFTSAKSLKRKFETSLNESDTSRPVPLTASAKKERKKIPEPTSEELNTLFNQLKATGRKPAILSIVSEFSDDYVPISVSKNLPKPLTYLRDKQALLLCENDLREKCNNIILGITEEEVENVEQLTRAQSNEKLWFEYRAGRITASNMKAACHTDIKKPSESLIKKICYPNNIFQNAATQWGLKHESVAQKALLSSVSGSHDNAQLQESGLHISLEQPFIAASPDGILKCDCCGMSCVEVKCPFSIKGSVIDESLPCLTRCEDGCLRLDRKHQYFYQVQTQLGVTKLESCYFVIWTEVDVHVEQILFDRDFWEIIVSKSESLFKKAVLPELVGKLFTRLPGTVQSTSSKSVQSSEKNVENIDVLVDKNMQPVNVQNTNTDKANEATFCYCNGVEEGKMVGCDNENCKITWFHFSCVNLKKSPKEDKWYCPDCRKLPH